MRRLSKIKVTPALLGFDYICIILILYIYMHVYKLNMCQLSESFTLIRTSNFNISES